VALHPPSLPFEEARKDILAVGPPPSKPEPAKGHQKRQPTIKQAATTTKKSREKRGVS